MHSADALLVLNPSDDVAVARRALVPGEELTGSAGSLSVIDPVAIGHKIALRDVPAGAAITKYGYQIGVASQPIRAGQHVHVHNLEFSAHTKPTADQFGSRGWQAPEAPALSLIHI